jgi:hypothetical protein
MISIAARWTRALGLLPLLLLAGCAQTYYLKVDALADPARAGEGQTFVLESGAKEGQPENSLRFREAADYVSRALRARGYQPASEGAEADLRVALTTAISEPLNETETYSEPLYYRSRGYADVIRTPVKGKDGEVRYIATRIYVPPETRFAGFRNYDRSVIVYEKKLNLTARNATGEEVWTLSVRSVDYSDDLRSYLPYLAAAAVPYLGERTEGAVVVEVSEDDATVQSLRGLSPRAVE